HKIGHALSVEHYGVMNDRPNTPALKQENIPVIAILDSGANCNIIGESIAKIVGLKIDNTSDTEIYSPISELNILGISRAMEILVLSQDQKWKQVEVSNVFITNKPELESVLILGQPWFQENAMKVNFPNKTLTLLSETSCEIKCVFVENLYGDVIGEIKCLDLQFQYKGKWRSLDGTEVIDFQICKNPSFDLVLGQDWLWMCRAKISFGFSSETCSHHAKIVIDGMSIPLIEDSNKASSSKNNLFDSSNSETETNSSNFNSHNHTQKKKYKSSHKMATSDLRPKPDLSLEELTNMLKKLSLRSKDNKYQKRHHRIFHNIPLTSRRSDDDFSKVIQKVRMAKSRNNRHKTL
ncbi:40222_t:CDS:2, partial [Gigaspora margarita]